jgi:DNA-binding response OmpR family regulator
VLFVDLEAVAAQYSAALSERYRITHASTAGGALEHLGGRSPALVVTELDLADGPGESICRSAKALREPATVLVMTPDVRRVPAALAAGCDGVLLKPFAPNLLYARMGRLIRERSMELRLKARRQQAKSAHLFERSELLEARSNRVWPATHCPYCAHAGVTSFDYASHRRAWYACLACSRVWLAKRQEAD